MEFQSNLQSYLDQLDYAEDWTWFDAEDNALSDEEAAAMTTADKAAAFVEGRYAKSSTKGMGGMRGGMGFVEFFAAFVGLNGVIEAAVTFVVGGAISTALLGYLGKHAE